MEIFFFFFFVLYKRKFSSFSLFLSFVLLLWGCALVGNPQGKNVSVGNFLYDKTFPSTLSADYFMLPSNLVKYPSESRLLQMKNSFCLRSCLTWHRPKKQNWLNIKIHVKSVEITAWHTIFVSPIMSRATSSRLEQKWNAFRLSFTAGY